MENGEAPRQQFADGGATDSPSVMQFSQPNGESELLCDHSQVKGRCRYAGGCEYGVRGTQPTILDANGEPYPSVVADPAVDAAAIYLALPTGNDYKAEPGTRGAFVKVMRKSPAHAAREREPANPETQSRFATQSFADVTIEVAAAGQPQWLFEPVIVGGDYGMLSAEKKAGKTWAVLDAAVSCAAGLPWLGEYPCRMQGPVIVFYGEGSRRKMVRRTRAIGKSKGLADQQVTELPIFVEFRAPQLGNAVHLQLIKEAIERHRPALVIIDPLYLSANGAKGFDLYSMGALLGGIQAIAQESGTSLLIAHHWNKGGVGSGHDRSSGVGPAEWGRFLISVAVLSKRTDPISKESTVRLKWSFAGDEIPDEEIVTVRRVSSVDAADLNSPMHYRIDSDASDEVGEEADRLAPAERKLFEALLSDRAQTSRELVDQVAKKYGHGLTRPTVSNALNRLAKLGLADQVGTTGAAGAKNWLRIDKEAGE